MTESPRIFPINGKVTIHSEELFNKIKDSDFDNCELTTIIDVILDEVVYYLGIRRTELFRKFDELFERITEGQVKKKSKGSKEGDPNTLLRLTILCG